MTKPNERGGVVERMENPPALTREIIDEDIQIVRATLAAMSDEVSRISADAGRAFHQAMDKIEEAHEEILRSPRTAGDADY